MTFASVAQRGQENATSGLHHLLLIGPEGKVSAQLSSGLASVLPPMTTEQIEMLGSVPRITPFPMLG